mgnify:CR=1 FL=1
MGGALPHKVILDCAAIKQSSDCAATFAAPPPPIAKNREGFQGLRSMRNRSILGVCEDFEYERNRRYGARAESVCTLCRVVRRKSPCKGINAEITSIFRYRTKKPDHSFRAVGRDINYFKVVKSYFSATFTFLTSQVEAIEVVEVYLYAIWIDLPT